MNFESYKRWKVRGVFGDDRQFASHIEHRAVEHLRHRADRRLYNLGYTPFGGEEHRLVELADRSGVDAHLAADGMDSREWARGRHIERPDTIRAEYHERVLSELSLRKGASSRCQSQDSADADCVDALQREVEGVINLGGVEFVGKENRCIWVGMAFNIIRIRL